MVGWPFSRPPSLDMIETSESTRSGCSMAMVWAIMPPIEAPTTCARSDVEGVEQADGVVGHVGQRVGGGLLVAQRDLPDASAACRRPCVERPTSRLSKRTTWKPRSTSISQKLLVPGEHLRPEAHDEQDRRVRAGSPNFS